MAYNRTKQSNNAALLRDFADIYDTFALVRRKINRVKDQVVDQDVFAGLPGAANSETINGFDITVKQLRDGLIALNVLADLFDEDAGTGAGTVNHGELAEDSPFDVTIRSIRFDYSVVNSTGNPQF